MRITAIILASIVVGGTACTDVSAPPNSPAAVVSTNTRQAVREISQGDTEKMASAFDDAASRLLLSFPAGTTTTSLREALVLAATSIRAGELTTASSAIENAQAILALVDSKEMNPDAVAIRLVLRYATSTSAALAPETH